MSMRNSGIKDYFLDINSLIYSLQSNFRQKHLPNHALINLNESIRQTLDECNFGTYGGSFIALQYICRLAKGF